MTTSPRPLGPERLREFERDIDDLQVGKDVRVGDRVLIAGDRIVIGDGTTIHDGSEIRVLDRLVIAKNSIIGKEAVIRGRDIELGREFYSLNNFEIGGGSCFENSSSLRVGYWFHGGRNTFINTARAVRIGDEVGIGGGSSLYTHGAYLNVLEGFPDQWGEIQIGSNVWMPNATVHPNVKIGSNIVIGGGSIVTRDIPSNCFALGAPCKVVRENCYPQPLDRPSAKRKLMELLSVHGSDYLAADVTDDAQIVFQGAVFDPFDKTITGKTTPETELLRDRLRRHGIRFKVDVQGDHYVPWSDSQ